MRLFIRAALVALAVVLGVAVTTTGPVFVTTAQAQTALLDINSATVAQLDALKGIGPVRAAAIVKGRPYKRKDELVTRNIIPQSVYDDIKDLIIAKQ
jgi:DNA uptake protein ComE-like DNA-binding protein